MYEYGGVTRWIFLNVFFLDYNTEKPVCKCFDTVPLIAFHKVKKQKQKEYPAHLKIHTFFTLFCLVLEGNMYSKAMYF
jgi:hypothetical protein